MNWVDLDRTVLATFARAMFALAMFTLGQPAPGKAV